MDQVEGYIALASAHGCDAVITISKAFAQSPTQHPLNISGKVRMKNGVKFYYWSWLSVLTEADLLFSNDDIVDADQKYLLSELARFLTHSSTGVNAFHSMPKAWRELSQKLRAIGEINLRDTDVGDIVAVWNQAIRVLELQLSQRIGVPVSAKLSLAHAPNIAARSKSDIAVQRGCHWEFGHPLGGWQNVGLFEDSI